MPARRRKRLDPAAFNLPVDQIREGFYSDAHVMRARALVRQDRRTPVVLVQFSGTTAGWLSGIDESVAVLRLCAEDWSALTVHALYEGDRYEAWDTVLTVEGPYEAFSHLAPLCAGTLARRTRVCTNAKLLTEAARSRPVFWFSAGDDTYLAQAGDGYAAMAGGVRVMSTAAQASLLGANRAVAAVPHALVALCSGDPARAAQRMADACEGLDLIATVDYDNDAVKASVEVARALEGRLWGVRLDTPDTMVDRSVIPQMGGFEPAGVNAALVWNVRNALDAEGFGEVKIVASGRVDPARIAAFEEDGVPVDAYGAGAGLFDGRFDFTADVVQVNGKPQARAGRRLSENPRLERVK